MFMNLFLNESEIIGYIISSIVNSNNSSGTQINGFKYFFITVIILFNIDMFAFS